MFVDEINLSVSSGAGGPGSVSFNNLNSKTKPSGGSGGDGGSVILQVNKELPDLSHIMSNSSLKAENGGPGNKNFQNGTSGCLLYTSPSPRDISGSRMPSSA